MTIEILINLSICIVGILVFYLLRRKEINRRIKEILLVELKNFIIRYFVIFFMVIVLSFYYVIKGLDNMIMDFVTGEKYPRNYNLKKKSVKERFLTYCQKQYVKSKPMGKIIEDHNSVSDMLVEKKSRINEDVMFGNFIFLIINYSLFFLGSIDVHYIIFALLTVLVWLIVICQILLIYRNEKGYYGTNYDEAKEIIYFIMKSSNDDINTHGGKKFLNEMEENIAITNGEKVIV